MGWTSLRSKIAHFISEFWVFGIRQAQACVFAGAMLGMIIVSKYLWPADAALPRYDFLFFYALLLQGLLILFKLESVEEVKVIFLFHIVGTVMEIFKTHVGSWAYPETNYIRLYGVPLFSGFMYSAVGSYIARIWRIFDFKFRHLPRHSHMMILCALIYVNFFSHHYIMDMRVFLFAVILVLFARTRIYYKPHRHYYWMPLLVGFLLVSFFIWLGENIGTFNATWIYPNQKQQWHIVSLSKMGSWFLLMIISFVLVACIHREESKLLPTAS